MTTPTTSSAALTTLRRAAQTNTASATLLDPSVYTAAGVHSVYGGNYLAAYNSALDSAAVKGANVNTTARVQTLVDAYNAILQLSMGYSGVPLPQPTAQQYAAIGVTGVHGAVDGGTALYLMDQCIFGMSPAKVDSVAEVQAIANAARHVMATAGGTARQAAALTLNDFTNLGITGVTAGNLAAVQHVIQLAASDTYVDTRHEIQDLINANLGTDRYSALAVIANAAYNNSATTATLGSNIYATAGVSGVNSSNLASINSALNSEAVSMLSASTTEQVQSIVNAYNAILTLSQGYGGIPLPVPTAAQFAAIGVTGVNGGVEVGAVHLLDSAIFGVTPGKVDTVAEVQAIADAANHIMAAAGGTATQAAALSLADFSSLGVTGVRAENLALIQHAVQTIANDAELNSRYDVQSLVGATLDTSAEGALSVIRNAASYNTAWAESLGTSLYATAGVHGVDTSNVSAINSALDSAAISTFETIRASDVQSIVDAYSAILHSADGVAGNTSVALSAAQYSAVGVSGMSGTATDGSALHLLNDVVDGKTRSAVDTVPELQALANAAQHVIAAAGGSAASASAVTMADLNLLGVYGQDILLPVFQNAIHAATPAAVDTRAELQSLLNISIQDDVIYMVAPVVSDYVAVVHPTILA